MTGDRQRKATMNEPPAKRVSCAPLVALLLLMFLIPMPIFFGVVAFLRYSSTRTIHLAVIALIGSMTVALVVPPFRERLLPHHPRLATITACLLWLGAIADPRGAFAALSLSVSITLLGAGLQRWLRHR